MSETTQELTPCGPLCDRKHTIDEPHNRNAAPVTQDHQQPVNAKADAEDIDVTFSWDGEEWTFNTGNANGLEFIAAVEDASDGSDPGGMVRAMRILLGHEQAARLFKGRQVPAINDFFDAAGEAGGMGNL